MENDRGRRSSARGASLTIVKGANVGAEFKLQDGEITIGRHADCNIVVSDIAVSRKHASVTLENGKYILRDLGSGNGTLMNEARISQSGEILEDGAVFKIGDTEISFSSGGRRAGRTSSAASAPRVSRQNVPAARARRGGGRDSIPEMPSERRSHDAPEKKSKVKVVLIALVCLVFIGGFTAFLVKRNEENEALAQAAAAHEEVVEGVKNEMAEFIDTGRKSSRNGKFREAIENFEAASKIVKSAQEEKGLSEIELPSDVKRLWDYSKKELGNQELIEKSRDQAEAGHLSESIKTLKQIPEDSFFQDRIKSIREEYEKYCPPFLDQARTLLKSKKFDEAQEAVEEVLAVNPKMPSALQVQEEIDRAASAARRPVRKKPVQPEEKPDPTLPILDIFYSGQIDGAIAAAKQCTEPACSRLAGKLENFASAFASVDKDTDSAFDALMAIPGAKKSTFYKGIAAKITTTLTKSGIAAMGSQNFSAAFKAFQKVVEIDPNHGVARKHLATIRQRAQETFQQAYVEKDVDAESARRRFEKVLTITAPSDELHVKSKRYLQKMMSGF